MAAVPDSPKLVAFLDMLGTSAAVSAGTFGHGTAYDFINPPGLAAQYLPEIRVAAFSDSVVISAEVQHAKEFVYALTFAHRQWFADAIAVRGAIALGEIEWVGDPVVERHFRSDNFSYARVYGQALVAATALEKKAGPGALCTVTQDACTILRSVSANAVADGPASYLVWASAREVLANEQLYKDLVATTEPDSDAWRHAKATWWYFNRLKEARQCVPGDIWPRMPAMVGSDDWTDDLAAPSSRATPDQSVG